MTHMTAVRIAQDLIRFNTVNPPGNEADAITYTGRILEGAGFSVKIYKLADNRTSLIADMAGRDGIPPLCFTGHLDTVGLGTAAWSIDPFGADISNGKLYGRGSTDMKGGIGAIIEASLRSPATRKAGLKLVLTAGEETGCEGACHLFNLGVLGAARAIVVAEPTSNIPCFGHRGVLWLRMQVLGRAAHGSMPELGDNAVVKAANIIGKLSHFDFGVQTHAHLGNPSLNIGYCRGGENVNVVPDHAEIGLDIRTTSEVNHNNLIQKITEAGGGVSVAAVLDLPAVFTNPEEPWFKDVVAIATSVSGSHVEPLIAPFFTDASVLAPGYDNPPVAILGPGEMSAAHCVDEYCHVQKIEQATDIYAELMHA